MVTQRHTWQDASPESEKAGSPDPHLAFAEQFLFHDEAHLGIQTVRRIADINLLTKNATVLDHYAVHANDATVLAHIHIISDDQLGMKRFASIRLNSTQPRIFSY